MDAFGHLATIVAAIVWPITLLVGLAIFRKPITDLTGTLGHRGFKVAAFNVELELATMAPPPPGLEATIASLRDVTVKDSGPLVIADSVVNSGEADFVTLTIAEEGSGKGWLTSRLFLLAALLESGRTVHCIVMTEPNGRFLAVATPRDIRANLGRQFPEYEAALAKAYGTKAEFPLAEFSGRNPGKPVVDRIIDTFLRDQTIEVLGAAGPATKEGWVLLKSDDPNKPPVWEFARWLSDRNLDLMAGNDLSRASVSDTLATEAKIQAIIRQKAHFVALLGRNGRFDALCDRVAILEQVATNAAAPPAQS